MSETTTVTKKRATKKRARQATAPERPNIPYVSDAQARVLCGIAHLIEMDELWRSPTNTEVSKLTGLAMSTVSEHVTNLIRCGVLIRPQRRPWHYIITDAGAEIVARMSSRYEFTGE